MNNMTSLIKFVVIVALAVVSIGFWYTSGALNLAILRYFSAIVFVATALWTAYDLWMWRWPLVQRLPGVPKSFRGTWRGTVTSLWKDPSTGASVPSVPAYLVVRQTSTTVKTRMLTAESTSTSSLAGVSNREGIANLHYLYFNEPRITFDDRSKMHHGSAVVEAAGTPARRIAGRYWTDRETRGELAFDARSGRVADDFEDAQKLFTERAAGGQ